MFICRPVEMVLPQRFFMRLLRSHSGEPKIVTDKLRSYGVVHRELIPDTIHSSEQHENNPVEQSYEATLVRAECAEIQIGRQVQRFLTAHTAVSNLFNLVGTGAKPNTFGISGPVRSMSGVTL